MPLMVACRIFSSSMMMEVLRHSISRLTYCGFTLGDLYVALRTITGDGQCPKYRHAPDARGLPGRIRFLKPGKLA